MKIQLRPPSEKDWPHILEVAREAAPWAGDQNQEWVNNRRAFDHTKYRRRQYVAEDTGIEKVIGYGAVEEGPEPGQFRIFIVMSPHLLTDGAGDVIYRNLLSDLAALHAVGVWAREEAADAGLLTFLHTHGFLETQRFIMPNGREAVVLEYEL